MKEWTNERMNGMIPRLLGQQQRRGPRSRVMRDGQISGLSHEKQHFQEAQNCPEQIQTLDSCPSPRAFPFATGALQR